MTAAASAHDAPKVAARPPVLKTPESWLVRLMDRRTGQTHRVNGSPLVIVSTTPEAAVADLMQGREASVWEARVEPLTTSNTKTGRPA
ncbi:hypothetical protein [Tabrizicola sp. BL-A-41-H6]|uniref:hypothetical protein n=1 Tax=Tabrizicola sp. BL-A-41-H6 TaxID=3421107 RepID=UPI003D66A4DC